jgi:hypothetical protein
MWITPKQDWNPNDLVSADDMNALGSNLAYLKLERARAAIAVTPGTTTSTAFATLRTLSLTTRGGALLIGFYAGCTHDSGGAVYFDASIDGSRLALFGTNGSLELRPGTTASLAGYSLLMTPVSEGTHSVALVWRTNTGTAAVSVGQFWAAEL